MKLKDRIRGYLPVVIDVETSGFNEQTDALLEICAIILGMDEEGSFFAKTTLHYHVEPFKGANIEASAIKFNGIDIDNPFRLAVPEKKALSEIFDHINEELETEECSRAILVGHNAFFDLGFVKAATLRANLKSPFHQFSTIDTVSLSALCCGETVLAKAISKMDIEWDNNEAHSALYDTQKTSELFCQIFNSHKFELKD
ncbi:ribonuclease T [Candidatus Pseudothioglobus singularis]|jgi:ribonuclease T|uniref:ribonuclease T n=1 Tax=Candidatus Pseudothioglobus singularis TaxID=1427364 RepID=UPI00080621F3|nr:ribonuclease T [Candidatus Pseudothioglobus singularis]MDC0630424.1 ribonuclease T [bacterium]MDG1344696.1 ribonuclease T [Candidatus Thioglobus sp.]ANQ66474.1 ribonuclease T [Candidatus Pseudothioglobus singularis]MDA8691546.1 ribonuclease T [Candidatus Pseudothioglobus singularis]MDA9031559.1 ribonuclease T [Candidatus Pseudothioglobus singularis]|tara:strand:+ start:2075 stop:2674 length:600 start_codon:yes stop_codon:yes gene_type:complete